MKLKFTIFFLSLFITSSIYSFGETGPEGVKVLEVSVSKKSVVFDRGVLEGLRIGEKAKVFYLDKSRGENNPRYVAVADAEAIKVHSNYSYWFLRNIENYALIEKDNKLVIMRESVDHRREVRNRHIKKVGNSQNSDKKNVPEDLVFFDRDHNVSAELVKTNKTTTKDTETHEQDDWILTGSEFDDEFEQDKKIVHVGEFKKADKANNVKKAFKKNVHDSTIKGSVGKINSLKYGLKGFYHDGLRNNDTNIKEKSDAVSMYEQEKENEKLRQFVSPRALAKVKSEGPGFSSEMDDAQLRRFFINSGIERELKRQKRALNERAGHELNFRFASGMSKNSNSDDPNHQSNDYGINFGYEFHLYNTHESLENFTLEGVIDRTIGHYDLGGINGRFLEGSFKGFINYYFWNPPQKLYSYLPFIGIGYRRGNADVTSFSLDKDYNYTLVGFPSYRFGLKYRFKAGDTKDETVKIGMGLSLMFSQETVQYAVVNTLTDNIFGTFQNNQSKFSVGLNVYF